MSDAPFLRRGDRGDAVRDVQQRLVAAGLRSPVDGALRRRDRRRPCARFRSGAGCGSTASAGRETWAELIESGYALGDRLLYLCQPMLRGDDVGELQRRLNALGFDAGREDGIFGPETESRARGASSATPGSPPTRSAAPRRSARSDGSARSPAGRSRRSASARGCAAAPARCAGMRVFVAGDLGLAALAAAVATGLRSERRRRSVLDTSGEDAALVAAERQPLRGRGVRRA